MSSKGKEVKQFKIILRADKEPELYKWAQQLPYGAFPRIIIEVLDWFDKNALLTRGGVISPDLMINQVNNQTTSLPLSENKEIEKEILRRVNEIADLLASQKQAGLSMPAIPKQDGFESLSFEKNHLVSPRQPEPMPVGASEPIEEHFAAPAPFKVFKPK